MINLEQRRNTRDRKAKLLGSDQVDSQSISFSLVEDNRETVVRTISIILQVEDDPKLTKKLNAAFWKNIIKDEMDSIMSNHTWKLVDLPTTSKPISCK